MCRALCTLNTLVTLRDQHSQTHQSRECDFQPTLLTWCDTIDLTRLFQHPLVHTRSIALQTYMLNPYNRRYHGTRFHRAFQDSTLILANFTVNATSDQHRFRAYAHHRPGATHQCPHILHPYGAHVQLGRLLSRFVLHIRPVLVARRFSDPLCPLRRLRDRSRLRSDWFGQDAHAFRMFTTCHHVSLSP